MNQAGLEPVKVPFHVKLAATSIILHGVIAVALAAAWASSNTWIRFPISLVELCGSFIVASGVVRLKSWAWKWGVYVGAFFACTGLLSAASLQYLRIRRWAIGGEQDVWVMIFGAMLIAIAVACLCSWQSREAFRRQSENPKFAPAYDVLRSPIPPPY